MTRIICIWLRTEIIVVDAPDRSRVWLVSSAERRERVNGDADTTQAQSRTVTAYGCIFRSHWEEGRLTFIPRSQTDYLTADQTDSCNRP
jgi:hypothetical protein